MKREGKGRQTHWYPVTEEKALTKKLKYRKFYLNLWKKFLSEGSQALEQVALRDSGVSILGETQNPTGNSREQPGLVEFALSKWLSSRSI